MEKTHLSKVTSIELSVEDPESGTLIDLQQASILIKKMQKFHTTLLFESDGWQALKEICLGISAVPDHSLTKGWRDLAAELELSYYEIGCIANYNHDDYTELVIKTYSQDICSTIDKLLQSIININRLDVIKRAYNSLDKLYSIHIQRQYEKKQTQTSTNNNNNVNNYKKFQQLQKIIIEEINQGAVIKGNKLYALFETLPITLKNNEKLTILCEDEKLAVFEKPNKRNDQLDVIDSAVNNYDYIIFKEVYSKDIEEKRNRNVKYEKVVMLSYASDGSEFVDAITKQFRTPRGDKLPIGVLTLNEQKIKVLENPEAFIMSVFPQVDYIIPILTPNYFKSLSNYSPKLNSLSKHCLLDENYTSLIHDLMCKYYVSNQCRNEKIRCIIPDYCISKITNHSQFLNDPTLRIWVSLSEVDTLINVMLTQ